MIRLKLKRPKLQFRVKGSGKSGFRGHAGRPGKRGGSTSKISSNMMAGNMTPIPDANYEPGITESYLAQIEDDGRAIVKPVESYTEVYANAEVMAYTMTQELGWEGLVPETVLTTSSDGRKASSQVWVEDATMAYTVTNWNDVDVESFSRMSLLDAAMGNTDRHLGNVLIKDGKVIAIDNGLGFRSANARSGLIKNELTWAEKFGRTDKIPVSSKDVTDLITLVKSDEFKDSMTSFYGNVNVWVDVLTRIHDLEDPTWFGRFFEVTD